MAAQWARLVTRTDREGFVPFGHRADRKTLVASARDASLRPTRDGFLVLGLNGEPLPGRRIDITTLEV